MKRNWEENKASVLSTLAFSMATPSHLLSSAWNGHLPLMFAAIKLLRPRLFVELGVHNGASFFAACQAVNRAGLETKCVAVDNWIGDPHAGQHSDSVFQVFDETLRTHYSDFASVVRADFSEAVDQFDDESIDLLHIDGFHTFEAVRSDYETWKPKLSERSVVLFHDVNEYRDDFGVWRFWSQIEGQFGERALKLGNDHGLGILFYGEKSVDAIGGQGSLDAMTESWDVVQVLFAGLGQYTKALVARNLQNFEQEGTVAEELSRTRELLAQREKELAGLGEAIQRVKETKSWKITKPLRALQKVMFGQFS